MSTPAFVTLRQLADRLKAEGLPVNANTIRSWARRGQVETKRSQSGHVYVTREEAEKVIAWRRPQ